MSGRDRRTDAGERAGRRALVRAGAELRVARRSAGLSQAVIGRAIGCSHATVSRIELGQGVGNVLDLARFGAVVGLDLSLGLHPAASPVRDAAHVRLLGRLRERLGHGLRWRLEVPLAIPGDRRAWDAVIEGPGGRVGVEAETRLLDLQAILRKVALKQRDDDMAVVVLLVNRTRFNVAVIRGAGDELAESFPIVGREALATLSSGRLPGQSGLVIL